MVWRLYRLPGSMLLWHVDNGAGTQIINVRGFEIYAGCYSVDKPTEHPRAWIELTNAELHVVDGVAVFLGIPTSCVVAEQASAPCAKDAAASAEPVPVSNR